MHLIKLGQDKRDFDPTSITDLTIYHSFLKESKWPNGCPFNVEWPNVTVTETIQRKVVQHFLDNVAFKNEKATQNSIRVNSKSRQKISQGTVWWEHPV